MARYTKPSFVDRAVEFAKRIQLALVGGETDIYDFTAVPGIVTDAGTEFDETLMTPLLTELGELSKFATDAKTSITLAAGDYTLTSVDYAKGLLIVATAHATNALILPTNYYYRYTIYNSDAVNTLLVKKSGGAAVSIPPSSGAVVIYNGSEYIIAGGSGALTGEVKEIAFAAIPSGWLLCDGSAVSRTTYANLFAKISTVYGVGDGSTTFNVPNKKGSVGAGYDSAVAAFDTLGKTGGVVAHALSEAELASHDHSVNHTHSSSGSHNHTVRAYNRNPGAGADEYVVPENAGYNQFRELMNTDDGEHSHSYSGNSGNAGSGNAHTNLQPYQVFNYIIKT